VYEDDSFFGAKALGDGDEESGQSMEADTVWVRAHELEMFGGETPHLFEGEIEPSDLCQGAVGDCWLVAALASASEHPDSVRSLFQVREYNPRGRYKVKIYDPLLKKFVYITVDDRIPCKKGTKKPRFMSPNGKELWAIMIEKAYAKWAGSYSKLDGGFVLWLWHSMTGDNVFQMSKNDDGSWYREDMVILDEKDDKRACGFRKTKETFTSDDIWTLLKKYDEQKALLSGSIGKTQYGQFSGPNGEQLLEGEGLAAGHAYSILAAVDVTNTPQVGLGDLKVDVDITGNAKHHKLLKLRNPWGTFEWKGDWSDKSKLWKENPHIAKKLEFEDSDDGCFWMSYEDFSGVYTRINVCDRTTTGDASLDTREDMGTCGLWAGCICGCAEYWLLCKGFRNLYFGHKSTTETLDTREKRCFCC